MLSLVRVSIGNGLTEARSEPSQALNKELFVKTVNGWNRVAIYSPFPDSLAFPWSSWNSWWFKEFSLRKNFIAYCDLIRSTCFCKNHLTKKLTLTLSILLKDFAKNRRNTLSLAKNTDTCSVPFVILKNSI